MKNVTINNKIYPNIYIGFNVMCKWARMGIDISSATDNPMQAFPMMQAYVAELMKTTPEKAGDEIDEHLKNGGDFNDIANGLTEAFSESGFFQALNKSEKKANPEDSTKKQEK